MSTKTSSISQKLGNTDQSNSDSLAATWRKTATQPWHEYMKTVQANDAKWKALQGSESAENEASKQRVKDYLTKYKHLF